MDLYSEYEPGSTQITIGYIRDKQNGRFTIYRRLNWLKISSDATMVGHWSAFGWCTVPNIVWISATTTNRACHGWSGYNGKCFLGTCCRAPETSRFPLHLHCSNHDIIGFYAGFLYIIFWDSVVVHACIIFGTVWWSMRALFLTSFSFDMWTDSTVNIRALPNAIRLYFQ